MIKMDDLERINGLNYIEELIISILLEKKGNKLKIGELIGKLLSDYEIKNISKVKKTIKNLLTKNPIHFLETNEDINKLTFTKEEICLSKFGKLYYIRENKVVTDFPFILLKERTYDIKDYKMKKIPLDRKVLFDYFNNNIKIEDLKLSKEFGRIYENEETVIVNLVESGLSDISYKTSYEKINPFNKYIIEGIELNSENEEIILDNSIKQVYLIQDNNEDKSMDLMSLEYLLTYYKSYINESYLKLYNEILLSDYKELNYEVKEVNYKYLVYNKETNEICFSETLISNPNILNLKIKEEINNYVVITNKTHEKLDLYNLDEDLLSIKNKGLKIKGLLEVSKYTNTNQEIYILSNKGEIKVMKESEVIGRNKSIKSTILDDEMKLTNILYRKKEEDYLLLLVTKKGFIKILRLDEYKPKNRESKYIMGIRLEEDDEVMFSYLLNDKEKELKLLINENEEKIYDIDYLISSKVNKGKNLNTDIEINTVKII